MNLKNSKDGMMSGRFRSAVAAAWLAALAFFPAQAEQASTVTPIVGPHTMADYAGDVNAALLAILSCNSGSSAPANGVGSLATHFQCWADTTTNPVVVKIYDGSNWVVVAKLNTGTHLWTPSYQGTDLGTASTGNTGTSGHTIPYLDASVTVSGTWTFSTPIAVSSGGTGSSTASGARTNLGLAIGSNVEAWAANLDALAGLTSAADTCFYFTGSGTAATFSCPSWARSVISAASATAGRTAFGLAIGSNVEAWDADLDGLAGLSTTGLVKRTGAGTFTAGVPAIADGGTGQTTQQAAFDALAPTATRAGDLLYWDGSHYAHLAGNNSGTQVLQENASGVPSWATISGTGTVISVGCGTGLSGGTITTSGTCAVNYASKSDQQSGSSNILAVTPLHQQDHPSAEKAFGYATLSGTTLTDHSPYGGTFSRAGVGAYTFTFSTAFANTNFSCTFTPIAASVASVFVAEEVGTRTTTTVFVAVTQATAFGAADPAGIEAHCGGTQ